MCCVFLLGLAECRLLLLMVVPPVDGCPPSCLIACSGINLYDTADSYGECTCCVRLGMSLQR